jgi:hypothetical protein
MTSDDVLLALGLVLVLAVGSQLVAARARTTRGHRSRLVHRQARPIGAVCARWESCPQRPIAVGGPL